jgi:AAA family ATP:ADP antiporter
VREIESGGGPLDRILRLFTDVRSGEGLTVLLLALNVFLLLTAYYFIKPLREALILDESGAEIKSYASALQALILLVAVPAYGALAGRWPRRTLINRVTLFFAACLVLFFVLGRSGLNLGVVFFLWVGIFNLMVIAQFWAFANDLYTNEQGERLFPLVQFGASAGAVFGSVVVGQLIEPLGIWLPMLIAAGILLASLLVTGAVDRREHRRDEARAAESLPESGSGSSSATASDPVRRGKEEGKGAGAFSLVFRSRYLLLIALLVLLMNWVNTTGEYILGSVVEDAAREAVARGAAEGQSVGQYIGSFYSDFFAVVNVAGLLLQLFVVSRIVKYLGIRIAILFLPIIALGSYGLIAFLPVLGIVRWAKTAENSTDYSLQNTVRQTLFLPLTRDQKYKAKQAIDAFFWRAGDVLSAGLVWIGTTWLALDASGFAKFNILLVLIWLGLSVAIGREYSRRVKGRMGEGANARVVEG